MRVAILLPALIPFLIFAAKDHKLHMRERPVPLFEHILHAGLFLTLIVLVGGAFLASMRQMFYGLVGFLALGVWDELVYHHDIPVEEHSIHAKQHLLLFAFVALAFGLSYFGGWAA